MLIRFEVMVEVERVAGKFASRDEIVEALSDDLDRANPEEVGGIGADGASEYEVTMWEVEAV